MIDRKQANIDRINDLWELHKWELHKREDEEVATEDGRCLAFVIDRRYLEGREGGETRLGVSFGDPIVGPETKKGLIPIPVHAGKFVFGLHGVHIKRNQLWIGEEWMDALDAGGCTDPVEAEAKARAILEAMSDEQYFEKVWAPDCEDPVKVSSVFLLEDFEVLRGQPWDSLQEFPERVTKLDLTQFTGSANVYRNRGLVYTDGINYLVKRVWARWLIDAITDLQDDPRIQTNPRLRAFQVWRLKHDDKGGASLTCWADTEGEQSPVIAEDIMSNFPEDITLYVENGKLMLPSERQTTSSPAVEGLTQGPREARRDLHGPASGS